LVLQGIDELVCRETYLIFKTENEISEIKIEKQYLEYLDIVYISQNRKKVLKFETPRHPSLMQNITVEIFFDGLEGKEIKIISF